MVAYKPLIVWLLACVTLLQSLATPLLYLDFQLRRDYIARVLCVNRDKPQLHCNGRCYLAKKMKAQAEQESKTPESGKKAFEMPWHCLLPAALLPATEWLLRPVFSGYYLLKTYQHFPATLFPPPRF